MQEIELHDILKKKLNYLCDYAWGHRIRWDDICEWLENFENNTHDYNYGKIHMLFLLSQFMYFGDRELREMIKALYRDKIRYNAISKVRKENNNTLDRDVIESAYKDELSKTRFLGVGNPSESGTHLLYYFRQENDLPKDLFINSHKIIKRDGQSISLLNDTVKHYVFIDDLSGSGTQACDYSSDILEDIKSLDPEVQVSYYVLFATDEGLSKIRDETLFDNVGCIFELDKTFKAFDDNSRFFKNTPDIIKKNIAHQVSLKYGNMLYPDDPLGYKDGQLLLGLFHNTPDNTLPTIWSESLSSISWRPIFKRYHKNYGWSI